MIPTSRALLAKDYVIQSDLATGFLGATILIRHKASQVLMICKMFKKSFISGPEKMSTFRERIQNLKEINLPFVVPFIELLENDDDFFLIRPYIDCTSLSEFVHKTPYIPESNIFTLWNTLTQQFMQLHKKGIFPSAIKPNNIFIGPKNQIMLTDLYELTSDISWALQTPDPMQIAFLAPEFFTRAEQPSAYSDIWSLGLILAFLTTRQLLWSTKNIMGMIKQITQPLIKFPEMPVSIQPIVEAMLAFETQNRPTIDDILDQERLLKITRRNRRSSVPIKPNSQSPFQRSAKNVLQPIAPIVMRPNSMRAHKTSTPEANTQSSSYTIRYRFVRPSTSSVQPTDMKIHSGDEL